MAKILFGPTIGEARGKVAGTVYSRNRYCNYIRNKTTPVNPSTPAQVAMRAAFTQASQRWRDVLTAAQREAWIDYGMMTPLTDQLGNKQPMAGNAMYCRYNAPVIRRTGVAVDDGPTTPGEATMMRVTLGGDTTLGVQITAWVPTLLAADWVGILNCAAPVAQSRNFFKGPFTWHDMIGGDTALPYTIIAPALVAIGQRWFFQFRAFVSDGRVGPPSIYQVDINA